MTRVIVWDIAKYKANINSSSKIWKSEGNFHVAEPERGELPFNDCKGYYSEFT